MAKENQILTFTYPKGVMQIHPAHEMIKSWAFREDEMLHARLAQAMAEVAEQGGLNQNHLMYLFPAVLRMLKVESEWTK